MSRIHVAEPRKRDNVARPAFIPEAALRKREQKKNAMEMDDEEEEEEEMVMDMAPGIQMVEVRKGGRRFFSTFLFTHVYYWRDNFSKFSISYTVLSYYWKVVLCFGGCFYAAVHTRFTKIMELKKKYNVDPCRVD